MGQVIGRADDFYRLRVIRMDESDDVDFEWRDDILYRRPLEETVEEYAVWRVEAVRLDDEDVTTPIGRFSSADEAHGWLVDVSDDIAEMTKSEFEDAYFPHS